MSCHTLIDINVPEFKECLEPNVHKYTSLSVLSCFFQNTIYRCVLSCVLSSPFVCVLSYILRYHLIVCPQCCAKKPLRVCPQLDGKYISLCKDGCPQLHCKISFLK